MIFQLTSLIFEKIGEPLFFFAIMTCFFIGKAVCHRALWTNGDFHSHQEQQSRA